MARDDDGRAAAGSRLLGLARRIGRRLREAGQERAGDKPVPSGPVQVVFQGRAQGPVPGGVSLLTAARVLEVELSHYCGGMCSCGTCRVQITAGAENLSRPQGNEELVLGDHRARAGDRLACQARVLGPVTVKVPDWF